MITIPGVDFNLLLQCPYLAGSCYISSYQVADGSYLYEKL